MKEKLRKVIEIYKNKTKKECYEIVIDNSEDIRIKDNKIGGKAYMPKGEEYPLDEDGNPMILLIQINLKDIELDGYPKKGILEVFIDKECSWPADYKIKYFEENLEYRTDLPEFPSNNYIIKKPLKIKLKKNIEHMPINDYRFANVMKEIIKEEIGIELKNYKEIIDLFESNDIDLYNVFYEEMSILNGNIGGYADFTQTDPREIGDLKEECLFKIDSNIGNGIMIGDCGIIFALISREDIEKGNFTNAVVDWDCC